MYNNINTVFTDELNGTKVSRDEWVAAYESCEKKFGKFSYELAELWANSSNVDLQYVPVLIDKHAVVNDQNKCVTAREAAGYLRAHPKLNIVRKPSSIDGELAPYNIAGVCRLIETVTGKNVPFEISPNANVSMAVKGVYLYCRGGDTIDEAKKI